MAQYAGDRLSGGLGNPPGKKHKPKDRKRSTITNILQDLSVLVMLSFFFFLKMVCLEKETQLESCHKKENFTCG